MGRRGGERGRSSKEGGQDGWREGTQLPGPATLAAEAMAVGRPVKAGPLEALKWDCAHVGTGQERTASQNVGWVCVRFLRGTAWSPCQSVAGAARVAMCGRSTVGGSWSCGLGATVARVVGCAYTGLCLD